jgi:glycerophosphoryl diester phosphodiesterase
MQILAHRGLTQHFPENTLAAFACALAAGFAGIETDVRLTADGEAVLFHDRVTPNGLAIAALTRNELSHALGYLVPTLAEALEALPDAMWNFEIKTPAAAPAAFALIRDFAPQRRILLTSFRHEVVLAAAQTLDVDCGLLVSHRPSALNTLLYAALPHSRLRTLVWHYEALDPSLLQQAAALGFHNWAYDAQTGFEHELCKEFGLDGIITDHPEHVGIETGQTLQ